MQSVIASHAKKYLGIGDVNELFTFLNGEIYFFDENVYVVIEYELVRGRIDQEKGILHKGFKNGKFIKTYSNGVKSWEQYYENGIKNGRSLYWRNNGQKWLEENYLHGVKHGPQIS